jgi:hypothetical protein
MPRIIMILSLFVLASCCDRVSKPGKHSKEELEYMTLSSLEKVNDYPLYIMTYCGDYGFQEYLETGRQIAMNVEAKPAYPWGCTCFSGLKNENCRILGRNFDWPEQSIPLLLFTDPPEGFASVSVVDLGFFGYTRDSLPDLRENRVNLLNTPWLPFDGLNEKGVAIGMMAIPHAVSPYDPEKITIGEIEMIRLVLDYAENLSHAISLIRDYNIRMEQPPIHYLIADRSGKSAIIEFCEGEMKIIPNPGPWQVSTNFIFGELEDPFRAGCWRFNRACSILGANDGDVTSSSAMEILKSVSHENTIWSVVYNMSSGDISIATGSDFPNTLYYNLYD